MSIERTKKVSSLRSSSREPPRRRRPRGGATGGAAAVKPAADVADPQQQHEYRDRTLPYADRSSYNSQFKVGIYGWRKKCLYALVMALMLMMIVNFALTLHVCVRACMSERVSLSVYVCERVRACVCARERVCVSVCVHVYAVDLFWAMRKKRKTRYTKNKEGMGQLRVIPGGLQLLGQALVLDSLFTSNIKSRRGLPLSMESTRNFTVSSRDAHGSLQTRLFLGHDRMEVTAPRLEVRDARGLLLLGAARGAVTLGADALAVAGPAGAAFHSAAQTPLVRAPPSKQLVLESATRSLEMHAAQGVGIESRAGDISATCLTTFRLRSVAGSIRLDAQNVYLPKLKSALPLPTSSSHTHDPHHQNIYQLCACANGKLFLAPPHGICAAREDSLICR
ncbi:Delta-sarcoglycan [Eumeta japonica]|uniref:Delta-sarcoglycan n=1 Tax=Eumeta variegata TaxID=151549 RepID=A0A4C1WKI4_EUMVA|nr:Delta-sarcoglycan [Eumeta japonica]